MFFHKTAPFEMVFLFTMTQTPENSAAEGGSIAKKGKEDRQAAKKEAPASYASASWSRCRYGTWRSQKRKNQIEAQRQRVRFGKEEQRRERALTYKISRSKRYKACSDVVRVSL